MTAARCGPTKRRYRGRACSASPRPRFPTVWWWRASVRASSPRLRAETGDVAWTDSVAGTRGQASLAEISAIRGLPAIAEGQVYAIGLGGLLLATDLRSGRRLWEREVSGQDSPWVAGEWLFIVSADQQIAADAAPRRAGCLGRRPPTIRRRGEANPIRSCGSVRSSSATGLIAVGTNKQVIDDQIRIRARSEFGRQLSGAASLGPVVANGTVLVVTDEGRLLALR